MANKARVVWDNAVDRCLSLGSTSTAISVLNLQTNNKSEVYRSGAVTSITISVGWTDLETVSCIAFPHCNLSPTATMRVRAYSDTAGTILISDSGTNVCTGGAASKVYGLTAAQASSAYSYGGGTCAVTYITPQAVRKLVVDIVDTSNLQGYIEAARMVVGEYWSPVYDVEVGVEVGYEDTSNSVRSGAGNLLIDSGTQYKTLSVNVGVMAEVDRAKFWKIMSYCGTKQPVFISATPGNTNKDLEQANTIYGNFAKVSKLTTKSYGVYSAPIEIQGI